MTFTATLDDLGTFLLRAGISFACFLVLTVRGRFGVLSEPFVRARVLSLAHFGMCMVVLMCAAGVALAEPAASILPFLTGCIAAYLLIVNFLKREWPETTQGRPPTGQPVARTQNRRANCVVAGYALTLGALVIVAPQGYVPLLPAARAFSEISSDPGSSGFAIDAMWLAAPFFLAALAWAAPDFGRFRSTAQRAACVVLVALLLTPAIVYFGTLNTDFVLSSRLGRAISFSAESNLAFVLVWGIYFSIALSATWFSYIALPLNIFRDRRI